MLGCLTELAKPWVEKLINRTATELSYICCFTWIAKDFEEEKDRLESIRTTIKQRIDVAIRNGEQIRDTASFWEKQVDQLIQEDTKTKQKCFFKLCPHCLSRYKRGKILANEKEHIKKLIEDAKTLEIGLPAPLPGVERYSSENYMHFKSRESKYKELLDELKDGNNYIIRLQGMGGTGKTTLIKEVGKQLKNSKQFTHIPFTTVSLFPNIKKIQDDIAGSLGLNMDDMNESDRPKKLWSRLTNGEKILLILDDMWGDIDFEEIGIPSSDNHQGCRLIVTTRDLSVCNKLGCTKTIELNLLSEDDAWIMFKKHAGLSEISKNVLLDKSRKIAKECKRLPIAIAIIASSLKGEKHPGDWDMTLKSLQNMSMHGGGDDELDKIYTCLKFSFDNMKNEKDKSLFLLCSLFREDEEILIEKLTRLAIGGGLLGEAYGSYEDARSQVVKSKNKLLDSFLLLEVDHWTLKMHDLVRDVARWIANKEIQSVQVHDKNQKAMVEKERNIKYLSCEGKAKDVFSYKLDGSKLEILIVIVHRDKDGLNVEFEVPDSFFQNHTSLRVFHLLVDDYLKGVSSLPQSVKLLKNIRSLIFTRADLGDISVLGNLPSLETLDMDHCDINELPHGITNLEKFRLLKFECCKIRRNNPFEVIKSCSSLEELHFVKSFNGFCGAIDFLELQRFCVSDDSVDCSSSKYVSVECSNVVFLSKTTLKYCMQEAEVLRLRRMEGGWRNIIPDIVLMDQGMNDLVELSLCCISQLQSLIETKHPYSHLSNVFSKLVLLHMEEMENLEDLSNGPLSFDSFKSLEKLSIKDCKHLQSIFKCNVNLCNLKKVSLKECPMLISLFDLSTARSLVLLEILEIVDCGYLENMITDERNEEGSKREIVDDDIRSRDPIFPKLKVLVIERCPKFEIILPFVSPQDLPALESITMKRCDRLKYIFGQDVKLGSLKYISLFAVPNLIDIFPECTAVSSSIKRSSSTASKPPTESDRMKCNIFSWTDMYSCCKNYERRLTSTTSTKIPLIYESQLQKNLVESNSHFFNIWERVQCLSRQSMILCNIKEIELFGISKIKSVFILSIAPRMLLETLTISDCGELKHIIVDTRDHDSTTGGNNLGNIFPKLKMLKVQGCWKLEYIFGHYNLDHENKTETHLHLLALERFILFEVPSFVAICPKQYYTTFPSLKELVLIGLHVGSISISHMTRSAYRTITKEFSENMPSLETLVLDNSKLESIFCVNEVNQHKMNLGLQNILLHRQLVMTSLFEGPKSSFALLNLTTIKIVQCEKLEIIFSDSILKCLPQLVHLIINECGELKNIIEDDSENQNMSNSSSSKTCFPKLRILVVDKCNKLKSVFPVSVCNELPELNVLIVRESHEIEEIFQSEGEEGIQKVMPPNLKVVVVGNLPSLSETHIIQFQTVKYNFVQNCQKLSFTSVSTYADFTNIMYLIRSLAMDQETSTYMRYLFEELQLKAGVEIIPCYYYAGGTINPYYYDSGIEVEEASSYALKSSQVNTILKTKNKTPKQKGIEISVEEGTTSSNVKTITSLTNLELEYGDGQIDTVSFSISKTDPLTVEDDVVLEDSPETAQTNNQGDSSQIVEDFGSCLLVPTELDQLVSEKHLHRENLSLLTDFLVKHPSLLLRDASLSNRYKGCAYNFLAELLKFLQTYSVLDVLGSSHSEFVELLKDTRRFPFDKEWLDVVEKRVLFPGLQVSQAALQKLLDSKHIFIEHVKELKPFWKISLIRRHKF
ncbi:uncharacterized protein LOC127084404 [Lathyrus oleraceus]|uniref:P-loop containing nucleoside triphosphate hydrolase, leucine-rich repeat domain, L n=1 Tax=Pisum sativum TaxID=3888 RepID=A0A9D4WSQ1_PEA|nr:uncharacterized protein LOC127084404 [Pisum sativum]KAI5408404.1 hypothetical protein KIW84_054293 [Pisum sativum]